MVIKIDNDIDIDANDDDNVMIMVVMMTMLMMVSASINLHKWWYLRSYSVPFPHFPHHLPPSNINLQLSNKFKWVFNVNSILEFSVKRIFI